VKKHKKQRRGCYEHFVGSLKHRKEKEAIQERAKPAKNDKEEVGSVNRPRTLTTWRKNPKVHHRTHNSPPPVPILSQANPIHTSQANLPKIHSDPILPPTPWLSNLVRISLLSHACHMPCPPHSPWLDLSNDIWGWVQIMKSEENCIYCQRTFSN
jgi:hypothetical protein